MNNINLTVKLERAISELRRGGKVVITDNYKNLSILLTPAELIQDDTVDQFSIFFSKKVTLNGVCKRVISVSSIFIKG